MTVQAVYAPAQLIEVIVERGLVSAVVTGLSAARVEVSAAPVAVLDVTTPTIELVQVVTPGPTGPQGTTGDTGEVGATGPSPIYEQTFAVAAYLWEIHHDLNTHPVVTTVDTNGDEIIGDVSFPDNATVIVEFGMPVAGIARLKG